AAADDGETFGFVRERAQPAIVGGGSVINDFIAAESESPRRAARRQQEFLERILRALVVGQPFALWVDCLHGAPEVKLRVLLGRTAPDVVERLVFPKAFGQWRPVIRRIRFGA